MDPFVTYIQELRLIRSSGSAVKETSYYTPLANLLNAVGKTLKPPVRCIINIKNRGAGIPDGGLFTPDQFARADAEPLDPGNPSRGVVEVKGTGDDAWVVADSKQVSKYYGKYRQVLVTNYRDFVLLAADETGRPIKLETYRLAPNEAAFWAAAADPAALAALHGERFTDYLKRVLLHAAPLATPQDVAWFLASYARDARARVERADLPALATVRSALEQALGITFQGSKGDHFFRSTFVQTLFYGVFSSWVLWSKGQDQSSTGERFNWRMAAWTLRVPMISALFEQVATPSNLGPLGLVEVLDWTGAALNRVGRAAFFARFAEDHAVQYFYEPFLEAFDPELRKELGVWYTPIEIVSYMVARVDTVLREELGIPDGLADPRVYVLDPCCGTGAYLVEVIRHIAATLAAKGTDALGGDDLKRAALQRVFGFELLPAPFVVAHLQLSLLLQSLGAPLAEGTDERAAVYLTNALTGWDPAEQPKQYTFPLPEMAEERDAAERVKRETPILVILGNPPYNSYAGVAIGEERVLSDAYRKARATRQPQGQGLNDLYVRFFRMAERRIAEQTGRGVVCFISNYSWLDGLSFTAMRERYLAAFDSIWIDCLNGDKYKTGKVTPEGLPDPSIFSTERNREGIQVGTAIALLIRKADHQPATRVRFRHLWGREKRAQLLAEAAQGHPDGYQRVQPPNDWGLPFLPMRAEVAYATWPALPDLFPRSFPGVKTSRDDVVVDIDRDRLVERMRQYFDPAISHQEMHHRVPGAMQSTARFSAEAVRDQLRKRGFLPERVVRYCYRPFDVRWLYWEPETKLLDEKRTDYFPHVFPENYWLSAGERNRKEAFYQPQLTRALADHHIVESNVAMFPLYLRGPITASLLEQDGGTGPKPNVSMAAIAYLELVGSTEQDLFFHSLAVLHAPLFSGENGGALRQDWPHVPLPLTAEALTASAALGRQLATLLDAETKVPGVTDGTIRPELRLLGQIMRAGGGNLNPDAGELALRAGWGSAGQGGVTMPGKGRAIQRPYTEEELAADLWAGAHPELALGQAHLPLGSHTYDIYLNDLAYWRNVPARVWDYSIGGYQVIKKWLSYREIGLLGRSLTPDEAREVTSMVHRIAAILLLEPALDANYQAVKGACYVWPSATAAAQPTLWTT